MSMEIRTGGRSSFRRMLTATPSPLTTTGPSVQECLAAECEKLKQLLGRLPEAEETPTRELREIRRGVRSLRGGFKLLGLTKSTDRDLQAIARVLAAPREAIRRIEIWRKLGWIGDATIAAAVSSLLTQQAGSQLLAPTPAVIGWCASRLESATAALRGAPTKKATHTHGALKRLGRTAARCALRMAASGSGFEAARKALRAWTTAVAVTGESEAPGLRNTARLAGLLRDERDLTRFADWLENHGFTRKLAPDLWRELKQTTATTRKDAIAAAGEVFA